jgi:hypothetical protein
MRERKWESVSDLLRSLTCNYILKPAYWSDQKVADIHLWFLLNHWRTIALSIIDAGIRYNSCTSSSKLRDDLRTGQWLCGTCVLLPSCPLPIIIAVVLPPTVTQDNGVHKYSLISETTRTAGAIFPDTMSLQYKCFFTSACKRWHCKRSVIWSDYHIVFSSLNSNRDPLTDNKICKRGSRCLWWIRDRAIFILVILGIKMTYCLARSLRVDTHIGLRHDVRRTHVLLRHIFSCRQFCSKIHPVLSNETKCSQEIGSI